MSLRFIPRQMTKATFFKYTAPFFIFICFFILGIFLGKKPLIYPLTIPTHRLAFPLDPDDVYIISAYYYPKSKSLGNSAIALVLTAHHDILQRPTFDLLGMSESDNVLREVEIQRITPHNVCPWISLFITAQLIPNLSSLHIMLGSKFYKVPFQTVSYKKRGVVTCISPLFANEQWQNLILAAHLYKKYGSFMHLYARSIVEPVYKLMLEYQKEPWLRVNLSTIPIYEFNPNINVEFRSQAAAQTDCLLKYKESAEFISFMDLDDLLIPRLGATYLDEFNHLFNLELFKENNRKLRKSQRVIVKITDEQDPLPQEIQSNFWWKREVKQKKISFIHYMKENVHIESHYDPQKFSLIQMISSMYFNKKNETGKMVTRPEYFNHTWIHWPIDLPAGYIRYDVPLEQNVITHLKFLDEDKGPVNRNIREPQFMEPIARKKEIPRPLIPRKIIVELQEDLERMKRKSAIASLWPILPQKFFYLDLVTECFNRTFYNYHYGNRFDRIKCPGPDRCRLPISPGVSCANAEADFFSSTEGEIINVHFARNPRFVIRDGCIP